MEEVGGVQGAGTPIKGVIVIGLKTGEDFYG
jgi:hypothetical protein